MSGEKIMECCRTCKFCIWGTCHRYAPHILAGPYPKPKLEDDCWRWPVVPSYEWCGEWKTRGELEPEGETTNA